MANSNPLPDLSTVDIQAIQDSGPVHPIISLPPLTTIAENWDSVESADKSIHHNGTSCSDSDSEEEEDSSGRVEIRGSKSLRSRSSSSSSTCSSRSGSSDSQLSDATSDSSASSSDSCSSDESDSNSCSSASSSSSRGKPSRAGPGKVPTPTSGGTFAIRESNYDKGRVTLRLSTLQLDKKHDGYDQSASRCMSNRAAAPFPVTIEAIGATQTSSSLATTTKVTPSVVPQQGTGSKSSPNQVRKYFHHRGKALF